MRGQHPGISQPLPRQQSGYDDMQLLQQHYMYKQLQELQRQQQIQMGQEPKQQNSFNNISMVSRQPPVNQLPTLVNGVPLNDVSSCSWQSEFTGSDPKASGNSQVALIGNLNMAQHGGSPSVCGLMDSHQGQVLPSMGFVPHQGDQFYSMPISNTASNQYSQVHGMPQDFTDLMAKANANQAQQLSIESASFNSFLNNQNLYGNQSSLESGVLPSKQDFQGKKIFGHAAGENVNNVGGNFQQMNTIPSASEDREINVRHEHSNWSGNSQEKEAQPSRTTEISVGLDPTEQKILFSSDEEFNWDSSFGRSIMGTGTMQENHLEGTDLFNSFPSIQSGSWSALMQSAVAEASCGNVGKQDEWSSLTSQKLESTGGNCSGISSDSVKQQTAWFHNSLSHVSSLPPRSAPFENGEQPSSTLNSEEKTHIDPQNMEGAWGQQQNMLPYTLNCCPQDKGNSSWNINGPHSANFEASFKGSTEHGFTNDSVKSVHTDRDHSVNMWASDVNQVVASSHSMPGLESSKSGIGFPQMQNAAAMSSNSSKGNYEINQQGFYQHGVAYGKHVLDSSLNSQGVENMRNTNNQQKLNRRPQMWEPSLSNSDKVSGETNDRTKEHGSQRSLSNDSYVSSHSHPDRSSDSVGGARDNFPLSGNHIHSFPSGNQQIHDQIGQDVLAQSFHYHPMGNSVAGNEIKGHHKQVVHAQGLPQMVARGLRSPEQMSQWKTVTSGSLDMRLSNAKGMAVMHAECNNNGPDCKLSTSFNELAVKFPQSSQTGQTGQNMLELLHKVDQSREDDNDGTKSSFSDQDTLYCRNETKISEGTINNLNLTHHDTEFQNQKKTCFSSAVPVQKYKWDLHKFVPRQVATEASESNTQADNSMASKENDLSYVRNQLQQQPGGHTTSNHPANMSLNTRHDRDIYNIFSSPQLKIVNNDDSIETSQPPLLGISHRVPPFSFASSPETHSAAHSNVVSLTYHVNSQGQSQPMPADPSIKRNSTKQLNAADTGQISHSSLTSGMSQHNGISGIPHNVWTNISTERLSNNIPENGTPVSMQLMHSGKVDASSWISRKVTYQDRRNGENIPQNFGAFAQNLSNVNYANEHAAKVGSKKKVESEKSDTTSENPNIPQGKESVPKRPILSNTSTVHLHHEKRGKESSDNHHLWIDQSTAMNASPYSLLQQMQAMKAFEVNLNNRGSKRLKETETGLDSQQLTGKPLMFYGSNMVGNDPTDDPSAVAHHGSFPTDSRMLSFSSDGPEKQIATKPQVLGKEMSQDLSISQQPISQNYPHSFSMAPNNFPLVGHTDHQHVQINPQIAPSWFNHYGNSWKSNIPAMFGGLSGDLQNNARMAAEHFSMPNVSESMSTQCVPERKGDAATVLNDQLASLQELSSGVSEHDVIRPKKRKSATSDLLPWHREIMVGSDRLQNIRVAERDWVQSTNRLVEKAESQVGFSGDGYIMPQTRRRLILTTQLMQQLLPSLPAVMLSKPASAIYESVTYLAAKQSLGDACALTSCLGSDTCRHSDGENRLSGKSKASDKSRERVFLKLMENFVGRARKLETDLNRLEKRAAILDVKVECQDLERVAIINRFAKFHGRGQTDGEESSTCETSFNTFARRYVTPLNMSGNVPEGVVCLSL